MTLEGLLRNQSHYHTPKNVMLHYMSEQFP